MRYVTLQGNISMEQHLAEVCNSITLNGSVCQAFNYNLDTKIANFKGQLPQQPVDYGQAACVFPNVTLWVLSSGKHLIKPLPACTPVALVETCMLHIPSSLYCSASKPIHLKMQRCMKGVPF